MNTLRTRGYIPTFLWAFYLAFSGVWVAFPNALTDSAGPLPTMPINLFYLVIAPDLATPWTQEYYPFIGPPTFFGWLVFAAITLPSIFAVNYLALRLARALGGGDVEPRHVRVTGKR